MLRLANFRLVYNDQDFKPGLISWHSRGFTPDPCYVNIYVFNCHADVAQW